MKNSQKKPQDRDPQDTRESDDIINEVIRLNVDHLKIKIQSVIRWLKTVCSTFQDVAFDGPLLPLFIS